jgi:plasmid stability protein
MHAKLPHIACKKFFMPTLQVRNLPVELYHKLSSLAKSEHRSLAQETIVVLQKGLGMTVSGRERR